MTTTQCGLHALTLSGVEEPFHATLSPSEIEPGLFLVQFSLWSERPHQPPRCTISWAHPAVDIHAYWRSGGDHNKGLSPWGSRFVSRAMSQAPVVSLLSFQGKNGLTFAFSDALQAVGLNAGLEEESALFQCAIELFIEPTPPLVEYTATLLLDSRPFFYAENLRQVQAWWAEQPGYEPALVPEIARLPMYSTWYSFHQQVQATAVEEQSRLAKDLGCDAVIVDDGWQTTDNARGYAYTGDWQVTPEKIADMKAHVERVHDLGLKYILWYSVPFVGIHSQAYQRFASRLLYSIEELGTGVLDPRFPDVREYIITRYERALVEWNLDGFKLDFIDSFTVPKNEVIASGEGMDYLSVPAAVDRLMTDIMVRLRAIKPEILIEFRQTYIGPLMRKYGNMFRAGDCPNDALTNRIRTLDLRLLSGNTAVHADMLMWHPDEPVESAALQILNILFSVPQISVLLDRVPEAHNTMLRYWLTFWREQRDVLLDGELTPYSPELHYPLVIAATAQKLIAVLYATSVVGLGTELPDTLMVVNATRQERVVLDLAEDWGVGELTIRTCQGEIVRQERHILSAGLSGFIVPSSGLLTFQRAK
ncbi:glycoside hydrolase family 36 protein [Tengunoibacter tsumagoiensis]|uniref:Alpha-galactosidase n=1 Tax=Tengunoibacter tsumagoiensis TaxID=2014871 RepID=A0A402A519_9CHLR|nr:glycoside hydrolase family 36 protein [Tengunoibacter tsumagoiensis]GCE14101.1 hypothetical protein KTT_39600 [Tengunoibacter tsumagoiensis]